MIVLLKIATDEVCQEVFAKVAKRITLPDLRVPNVVLTVQLAIISPIRRYGDVQRAQE